jgi:hypothetical protein
MRVFNVLAALVIAVLLAGTFLAQGGGVVGWEVFSTSTPGGGGEMQSQGLTGERTAWFTSRAAPGQAGVANIVVTYYASKEDLDKAKAAEKKAKDEKNKKKAEPATPPPDVPTFDPRFYELKDGKVVPKTQKQHAVGEVIQPRDVHSNEPFTFAIAGMTAGEVVQIQTLQGEVREEAKTDNLGRVFLPSGLAAGSYLLASRVFSGSPKPLTIEPWTAVNTPVMPIKPAMNIPNTNPLNTPPMQLTPTSPVMDLAEPVRLEGQGFSPRAADMTVNDAPVLAATSRELVSAPLAQAPGHASLLVRNVRSGEMAQTTPVLFYNLEGHIEQQKLMSGQQTVLRLQFEPANFPAEVEARVVSGPVSFGQGRLVETTTIRNGEAFLPVAANTGSVGPFTLAWSMLADEAPKSPQGWLQQKATDCAAASRLTENTNNKKDLAKEAATDDKYANDSKAWDKDGQPTNPGQLKAFLNAEIKRLEKIARKEGDGNAKTKIADAIDAAFKAGKAAGLNLK